MPQTTINVEIEDKQEIVKLATEYAIKIKQSKVSQSQMVHTLIETFKETL